VAGAASGIGRVAARRWAAAGFTVAAADIDEAGLAETAAGIPAIHPRWLDVSDAEAVAAAVKDVESQLGPIERVYNGAAIQPTSLLVQQDVREIHRVMQINYGGLVNVSLATLPRMLERRRGVLVNFASIAGWVPTLHFGAYNASKLRRSPSPRCSTTRTGARACRSCASVRAASTRRCVRRGSLSRRSWRPARRRRARSP
jgi:NADP-dependent 3-hydroxy acid dehydrogenase YdfG